MTKIEKRLQKFGFTLQGTGGNCTAYVKTDGDVETLITLADDPSAPTKLTDAVAIGEVTEEKDPNVITGYTLADVLAALENPSDEHAFLSLKLKSKMTRTLTLFSDEQTKALRELAQELIDNYDEGLIASDNGKKILDILTNQTSANAANAQIIASRIIDEVRMDITRGLQPRDVADFSELHNLTDANEYGLEFAMALIGDEEKWQIDMIPLMATAQEIAHMYLVERAKQKVD